MKIGAETETWLEIAFVLLALGMAGMTAVLIFGSFSGASRKARGEGETRPYPGEIPPGRHRIHSVAIR